jgi:hypothetical protein
MPEQRALETPSEATPEQPEESSEPAPPEPTTAETAEPDVIVPEEPARLRVTPVDRLFSLSVDLGPARDALDALLRAGASAASEAASARERVPEPTPPAPEAPAFDEPAPPVPASPGATPAPAAPTGATEFTAQQTPGASAPATPSPGGTGPGQASDRDTDGATTRPEDITLGGQPRAVRGLLIRPSRAQWSITTRALARPRNPVVRIVFRRDGTVKDAEFLPGRGTGYADVDGPLRAAIYRFTAEGEALQRLSPTDPEAGVEITLRIILPGGR